MEDSLSKQSLSFLKRPFIVTPPRPEEDTAVPVLSEWITEFTRDQGPGFQRLKEWRSRQTHPEA